MFPLRVLPASPTLTRLPCQIDHVIAVKHHGFTRASNLALGCFACNNHESSSPPHPFPNHLFQPQRHKWVDISTAKPLLCHSPHTRTITCYN